RAGDLAEELVAAEEDVRVEARHRGLVAGEVEPLVGPVARRERLVEPRRVADDADRRAVRAHLDGAAAERLAERVLARPLRRRAVEPGGAEAGHDVRAGRFDLRRVHLEDRGVERTAAAEGA